MGRWQHAKTIKLQSARFSWNYWSNRILSVSTNCTACTEVRFSIIFVKNAAKALFIHSVFCLTTGSKPPPKRFLHIVRFRASSFKWQYPVLYLRSSSSFLRLLPLLLVISIAPFIFLSIICFRRQFLRKMWPIQLAFRFLISCRIFLCSFTLQHNVEKINVCVFTVAGYSFQHYSSN